MKFMGQVLRFTPMKDTARRDQYFHEFVKSKAIQYTEKYKMAMPNRAAMTKSISKYNRAQPTELNQRAWQIACDWTYKHFSPHMGSARIVDHDKARRDLDRTTSPGYPWSRFWGNKGQFLDSEEAPKIERMFWDSLSTEHPLQSFWTASLKRELRPVEKLAENKIRTFTASPTELSIATTRMCLDCNEKFYESNNKTWSFVGGSKYYQGFDRLYRRLDKHPNAFELDESSFDASLFRKAMESVRDLRWEFYHDVEKTPENKRRLWNIYDQIINSIIVLDNGEVFQKNTGNPSGSANTIVDNTLILFMLFAYAFIMIMLERKETEKYATFEYFMTLVEAALNGDDNTFTVADEIVEYFNATSVSRIWTLIGVETKSPNFNPRKLSECEFLSHGFIQYNKMWLPICERDKALCSLMWGSEVDDVRFTLLRAYALRIETWPDEQARKDIMLFIDWLRKTFKHDLHGIIPDTDLTMLKINSVFKTDAELKRLYCLPPILEGFSYKYKMRKNFDPGWKEWKDFIDMVQEEVSTNRFAALNPEEEEVIGYSHMQVFIPKVCEPSIGVIPCDYKDPPINKYRGKSVNKSFDYVERNRNVHADSMPKGKGKQSKGGNPSKAEMQRRAAQSQRDKNKHNSPKHHGKGKPKHGNKPRKEFKTRVEAAPLAKGSQQITMGRGSRLHKFCHSEFIGAFTTGTDGKFTAMYTQDINPAQQGCAPWGFPIAGRFQTYSRRKGRTPLVIRVEPRNSASTDGETFISISYDARQTTPTTSQQLLQQRGASRANGWMKNKCVAQPDAVVQKSRYFCRPGSQPSNTDIREYDMGTIFVFYEGFTAAKTFDVWLDWDVDLENPFINPTGEAPNIGDFIHSQSTFNGISFNNFSVVSGNGTLEYDFVGLTNGWDFALDDNQAGYYLVTSNIKAVGGTFTTNITATAINGATFVTGFCESGSTHAAAFTGGHAMYQALVHIPQGAVNAQVDFGAPTGYGSGDIVDCTAIFVGYDNGFTAAPTVSKKASQLDMKKSETHDVRKLIKSLLPDLMEEMKKSEGWMKVSEPTTPELSSLGDPKKGLLPSYMGTPIKDLIDQKEKALIGDVPAKGKSKK